MDDTLIPPCEDLLSEDYRRIWCGETDPTGRFVCRRVRDHALDFHAGRNDAGGIHQWKVAGVDARRENMPADMPAPAEQCASHAEEPIGLVRIEQRDGGHSTWQHVGGTPGNEWMCVWSSRGEEGCTLPPDGVAAFPVAGAVPGTPAAPVVDGSEVSVGSELRARCISALAEMPLEFISPDEFGGYDIHYAELVDIVLAEVQPVLAEADRCARRDRYTRDRWGAWWMEMREENKHRLDDAIQAGEEAEQLRAEIARLRGTNEALLAMLERMETLHVTWFGPDGEEYHPDWCRECRVDKVAAELADLESQRDAWWNQRAAELAEVRASREAWAIEAMGLDVELAERPTAWAYEQANKALEKRRVALVTALGSARPAQGFYDAVGDVEDLVAKRAALSRLLRGMARRASGQRRSKERLAMWAESRPAAPADGAASFGQRCEEQGRIPAGRYYLTCGVEVGENRQVVSRFDVPGGVRIAGFWPSHKARIEPAPPVDSDTADEDEASYVQAGQPWHDEMVNENAARPASSGGNTDTTADGEGR